MKKIKKKKKSSPKYLIQCYIFKKEEGSGIESGNLVKAK